MEQNYKWRLIIIFSLSLLKVVHKGKCWHIFSVCPLQRDVVAKVKPTAAAGSTHYIVSLSTQSSPITCMINHLVASDGHKVRTHL